MYIYIYMCICIHVCVHIYTHVHIHIANIYIYIYIYVYHISVYIYIYICIADLYYISAAPRGYEFGVLARARSLYRPFNPPLQKASRTRASRSEVSRGPETNSMRRSRRRRPLSEVHTEGHMTTGRSVET